MGLSLQKSGQWHKTHWKGHYLMSLMTQTGENWPCPQVNQYLSMLLAPLYLFLVLTGCVKENTVLLTLGQAFRPHWQRQRLVCDHSNVLSSPCRFQSWRGLWWPKELWHYHTQIHTFNSVLTHRRFMALNNTWLAYSYLMLAQAFWLWQTSAYEMPIKRVWISDITWWQQDF